jgi:O-antigen/teichoic acid export membrane protein
MSQKNATQALKNTLFLYVRMLVVMIIGLYTSRVILSTLGFEDFGIYNVVGSVVIFFSFLNAALTNATSRYLTYELGTGDRKRLNETYSMAINSHLILALGLFVLMEAGGVWFVNHRLNIAPERMTAANWCYQFSLLVFCLSVIRVPFHSNVIAHEKMDFYAVASIVEASLKLGIVFMLLASPVDKLITYSILMAAVALVILLVYIIYCRVALMDCRFMRFWDSKMLGRFASYSGYSMLVNGADGVTVQCRNVFFNWFTGTLANAAMGIANQVISLLNVFVESFSQALRPQIIKSYAAGEHGYFMQLLYSASKMNYYLFLLISIPIALNLDYILTLWLDNYPPLTAPFVLAIMAYTAFDVFQQPLWQAVHATGNLKVHQIMIASIKIMAIPATYVALWLGYSPVVALYLWAGLNMVCAIARTLYMRKLIGLELGRYLREVVLKIVVVTLLSLPIPLVLSWVIEREWLQLVVTTFTGLTVTAAASYFIGLSSTEKHFLHNLGAVQRVVSAFKRS